MDGRKKKVSKGWFHSLVQRAFILSREGMEPWLANRLLESLKWVGHVEHLFGPIEGRQNSR